MLEDFCGPQTWGPRKSGTHIRTEVLVGRARGVSGARVQPSCAVARPSDYIVAGCARCESARACGKIFFTRAMSCRCTEYGLRVPRAQSHGVQG